MERTLTKALGNSLVVYIRRREEVVAKEIETCLETPKGTPSDIQGAYLILKQWYLHTSGIQPQPSHTDLEKVSGDYASLYQREDPSTLDRPIPTHTNLFNIDDETSTNGDIEAAVRQMRRNREDKHKHLQAEHNQQWIREAYTTETSTAHTNST